MWIKKINVIFFGRPDLDIICNSKKHLYGKINSSSMRFTYKKFMLQHSICLLSVIVSCMSVFLLLLIYCGYLYMMIYFGRYSASIIYYYQLYPICLPNQLRSGHPSARKWNSMPYITFVVMCLMIILMIISVHEMVWSGIRKFYFSLLLHMVMPHSSIYPFI